MLLDLLRRCSVAHAQPWLIDFVEKIIELYIDLPRLLAVGIIDLGKGGHGGALTDAVTCVSQSLKILQCAVDGIHPGSALRVLFCLLLFLRIFPFFLFTQKRLFLVSS